MRVPPAASPSAPASKHKPLAPESPIWASQRPPICGMRWAALGATLSATLSRAPRLPPSLGRPAFLLALFLPLRTGVSYVRNRTAGLILT